MHQRADQFQRQLDSFNQGKIPADDFQQLRLRNGLYRQRHAHMLRVAIPYGQLNSTQLTALAEIARKYDKGYGHFTTRQNIQYNWPELEDVPSILHELADVGMHAIQTSGSCIRNITSDHLAGVSADEDEDPRPWCELLRQWSTLHPEFNWLPRKFKIAVTGAQQDRTAMQFHDIGIRIVRNDDNQIRFHVYVGGGMGRTPVIGKLLNNDIKDNQLLGYLQAILRVYNKYGRRDNKYKARIKILVNHLGIEEFARQVNETWKAFEGSETEFNPGDIERTKKYFVKELVTHNSSRVKAIPVANSAFINWKKHNTSTHKIDGYTVVHISLKAAGEAPGDISADNMTALAQLTREFSQDEIRVTHEQNLVMPYVRNSHLYDLWHGLNQLNLATPNIGKLTDMIACPGLDFCSLANASTIPLAKELSEKMSDWDKLYDIGEIKLKMSGCMNACGHHHVGHIGILGVDKKGEEWYQITLGGSADNMAKLGDRLGPAIEKAHLVDAIFNIVNTYLEFRLPSESFLQTVLRVGVNPFKQNLYASYKKSTTRAQPVAA